MKKIITAFFCLVVLSALSSVCIAAETNLKMPSPLFSFNFSEKSGGVVNGDNTATLTQNVEIDGETALEVIPNNVDPTGLPGIYLDCFSLDYSGKQLDLAKFAAVKYKYVCPEGKRSADTKMTIGIMKNGGAINNSIYFNSSNAIVENQWSYAIFNLSPIAGKVNLDKIFRQFHIMPFGMNVNPKDTNIGEIMYISEVEFYSVDPLEMNGIEELPNVYENNTTISFNANDYPVSIVNGDNTATIRKEVSIDGEKAIELIPNNVDPTGLSEIVIDYFPLGYSGQQLADSKFVTVKYKYICPEGKRSAADKMTIGIMRNGNALGSSTNFNSQNDIIENEWTYAVFNLASIKGKVQLDGLFRQLHIFPFGKGIDPKNTNNGEKFYISEIAFLTENPIKDTKYTVKFEGIDNPELQGTAPEDIAVLTGESYTLPESTFTLENSEFAGWRSSADGKLYAEGTTVENVDSDVTYTAKFRSTLPAPYVRSFDINGGTPDHADTAVIETVEFDGYQCLKMTPNPDSTQPDSEMTLDTFYSVIEEVDISKYNYCAVRYYIDGELPKDSNFKVRIMKNGNILYWSTECIASEPLVTGQWAYAVINLAKVKDRLHLDAEDYYLRQVHITPANGIKVSEFTGKETFYLSKIMYFTELPELETHDSYMKGYDGGLFKPGSTMTRAEAATIIARLSAGGDEKVPTNKTASFADVSADAWYYKYVSYIESLGFLDAYGENFLPDRAITRAEFVELVFKMGLLKDQGKNGTFTDVAQSHERAEVISAAGKAGLVNGYSNGDGTYSFKPDNTITRAEVVKVINNAYSRSVSIGELSPDVKYSYNDVTPDFWAYSEILEASLSHIETATGKWAASLDNSIDLTGGEERVDYPKGISYVSELNSIADRRREEIRSTPTSVTVTGTSYYVSEDGSDENDGKSPEAAWKTLSKVDSAELSSGDGVFFRRGDTFRGSFSAKAGVTYSAYGSGEKPKLYGSPESGAKADNWTLLDGTENIWVYNRNLTDVGAIVLNDGEAVANRVLADYYNNYYYVRGSKASTFFDVKTALANDLDYFSESASGEGKLYLRSDSGNPAGRFSSIEFNVGGVITVSGDNVHIDNLCLKYTAGHAIGSQSRQYLTVTNCEIGYIGGGILRYDSSAYGKAIRFGNGIEIYGSAKNYTVSNCYIYQCYDAGVTHQFDGKTTTIPVSMYDITYSDNLIEYCQYNIEYFLNDTNTKGIVRDGKNFKITGNILRCAGYGWGSIRDTGDAGSNIQGWGGTTRNEYEKGTFIISGNIFDRASSSLFNTSAKYTVWCPIFDGNTYVQYIGGPLGSNTAVNMKYDHMADYSIRDDLGDVNAEVYWLPAEYAPENAE